MLEMGVFDALPDDGSSMKAKDLAEHVKADPALLGMIKTSQNLRQCLLTYIEVRLMRCATFAGPFAETAPEEYAHTPHSLIYKAPAICGVTKMMFVINHPSM